MIDVSVVIPTCQRDRLLRRCLDALFVQEFDRRAYEIIVVDDAASGATEALVTELRRVHAAPALRYIPMLYRQGPGAARNVGWTMAQGTFIAFTDDDTIPARNWLAAGVGALRAGNGHEPPQAVAGRIGVPLGAQPSDYERDVAGLEKAEFATANCFVRRSALELVGGFDRRFQVAFREDSDLQFSLEKHGLHARYAPAAFVRHPVRPAPWGISVAQQQRSMYDVLLYKKHPALYRKRIRSEPLWDYYATVGTLAAAAIGAFSRRPWLALPALAAWLWLTGRFTAQRLKDTSHEPAHVAEMAVTSALIPPLALFWRVVGWVRYRAVLW
jgi:GT2 family glycosyltransferase